MSPNHSLYNCYILKLGDFGLARQQEHTFDLTAGKFGTPLYMAPEIDFADELYPYDHKVDIWSIGCVVYEICELECAFLPDTISPNWDFATLRRHIKDKTIPELAPSHPLSIILSK